MSETPTTQPSLRVSLILSGAISLGAYEAGVVSQIAYALEGWNKDGKERVRLDVISGASAGSITGAMLASHLMQGTDALALTQANWDVWCTDDVQLKTLLKVLPEDKNGFLSSSQLDELGNIYIAQTPTDEPKHTPPPELILSCTLTALNPIPFDVKVGKGAAETIHGITYHDQIVFHLTPKTASAPAGVEEILDPDSGPQFIACDWQRIAWAALASADIPAAWQPIQMVRDLRSYPKWPQTQTPMPVSAVVNYCDGGVVNNMPLDRASTALSALNNPGSDSDRLHVLIIPDPSVPDTKIPLSSGFSQKDGRNQDSPLLFPATNPLPGQFAVAGRVVDAVREQTFYRDLEKAEQVNNRIELRRSTLVPLAAAATAAQPPDLIEQELKRLQEVLSTSFGDEDAANLYLKKYKEDALSDRALQQYLVQFSQNTAQGDLFLMHMAAADRAADLDGKCLMEVVVISPTTPLAGDPDAHFGGLVDVSLMQYDFQRGIADALETLNHVASQKKLDTPAALFGQTLSNSVVFADPKPTTAAEIWKNLEGDVISNVKGDVISRAATFLDEQVPFQNWISKAANKFMGVGLLGLVFQAVGLCCINWGGGDWAEGAKLKAVIWCISGLICLMGGGFVSVVSILLLALRGPGRVRAVLLWLLGKVI